MLVLEKLLQMWTYTYTIHYLSHRATLTLLMGEITPVTCQNIQKGILCPGVHKFYYFTYVKFLSFWWEREFSLSPSPHSSTDRSWRGWTACELRVAKNLIQHKLLPFSAKQTSIGNLLGHPRFSSIDMGLETGQELKMHCDFLCPFLLLEPTSKSSFSFKKRTKESVSLSPCTYLLLTSCCYHDTWD